MNLLHLRYALEVEKTRSISKAAENLLMSQPNLSRAIKELEESLGITIFKRTSKGISVTFQGEEFLSHANQEIEEDVPFGGAPEYYKYRCSHCHFENTMNEANVDVAFGWTKKRTKCSRGLMPVLECPICSCLTYECVD